MGEPFYPEAVLPNSGSADCCGAMIKRQALVERKVSLFRMPAFWEHGRLLSQRPPSLFLERTEGFKGTQEEAEKRKGGVSHVMHPRQCLVCSEMVISNLVLGVIHMSSNRKSQSRIAALLLVSEWLRVD